MRELIAREGRSELCALTNHAGQRLALHALVLHQAN